MVWRVVQIWFYVCIFCVIPNKRTFISALPPQDNAYKLMFDMKKPDKWATTVLKEQVSVSGLEHTEPGFDFTDEEIKKFKLWPEGIIPYYIDDFSYDKVLRDRIRKFLDVTGRLTGLHFRELPSPPEDKKTRWIFFVNRLGQLDCSDHTPEKMSNEGIQKVVLGYHCMTVDGELPEAVLAIVGVPPQHNSPDRDDYVTVEMDNIIPEKQHLFQKLGDKDWLFHDLEYDFFSAGHFSFHKHTKDGHMTINPKKPVELPVGENNGFSYTDILKIRMLYNYISRKKSKVFKGPECDKLFRPGMNFSLFEPDPVQDIKPRKKPSKYLGLPDGDADNNSEKVESEKEDDGENENEDVSKEEKEIDENQESDEEDQKDAEESESKTKSKVKLAGKMRDPFQMYEDYESSDEKKKQNNKRKKKLKPSLRN